MRRTGLLITVLAGALAFSGCSSRSGHNDAYDRGSTAGGSGAGGSTAAQSGAPQPNQSTATSGALSGTGSDPNARTSRTTDQPGTGRAGVSQDPNKPNAAGSTAGNTATNTGNTAGTAADGTRSRTETPSPQTGMAPKQ